MDFKTLTSGLSVSPQITIADLPAIRDAGYRAASDLLLAQCVLHAQCCLMATCGMRLLVRTVAFSFCIIVLKIVGPFKCLIFEFPYLFSAV